MQLVMTRFCLLLLFACVLSASAGASTIVLMGAITQSIPDGTGPAFRNPSLNSIVDGEGFTLTLFPLTDITGPGLYNLTGSALNFTVPSASAMESSFGTITLNVLANGSFNDFSLLACLTGTNCLSGNALTANFRIPASGIGSTGVAAIGLDQPHPLDLLEDDGVTDIHASILIYSSTAQTTAVTPEPSSASLCAVALLATAVAGFFRPRFFSTVARRFL